MKKPLMLMICAGVVVLALLISIFVAHGKISSTERKLSLCNDELNKVSEQLKELKEYTANETFINQNKDGETTTVDEDDDDDDDDDDYYYYTRSSSTSSRSSYYNNNSDDDEDDEDSDDDDDRTYSRSTTAATRATSSSRTISIRTTRTTAHVDVDDDDE